MPSKHFFEKYAQLTLRFVGFEGVFELSDKPDLQNLEQSIGIEVVNVETKEEGIFNHLFNINSSKGLTSNEFIEKLSNPKFKQLVVPNISCLAAIPRCGEAKQIITNTTQTIQRKSALFPNYTHFNKNGLYLFSHIWEEQLTDLQEQIFQNDFPFDFYIIQYGSQISVITKDSIQTYKMSHQQLCETKTLSTEYANSLIKKQK